MKTIFTFAAFLVVIELASALSMPVSSEFSDSVLRMETGASDTVESRDSGILSLGFSPVIKRLAIGSLHGAFGLLGAFFFGFAVVGRLRAARAGRWFG